MCHLTCWLCEYLYQEHQTEWSDGVSNEHETTCGCIPKLAIIKSNNYCWKWKTSSTTVATLDITKWRPMALSIWCTDLMRFVAILAIVCARYTKIMNVIVTSVTSVHNYICILCPKKGEDYLHTWVAVLLDGERNPPQNRCEMFPISTISGKDGSSGISMSWVYGIIDRQRFITLGTGAHYFEYRHKRGL